MAAVKSVEIVTVISATYAANLPANNKVYATISIDPALPAVSQLTIPANEAWVLSDVFVSASQTPDSILEFFRNLLESKSKVGPINGLVVTNPARPYPDKVVWAGNDILSIVAQNLAAIGTAAATITAYAKFKRFIS